MRTAVFLFLVLTDSILAQEDLSYRVRVERLDQRFPITVNVSTRATTTLQFPAPIQSLEGDGFTQKPNEEEGDFYISPGLNWVSIRSLRAGAVQNLGVIISGKVYEIEVTTGPVNDFSVIFEFTPSSKSVARSQPAHVWSPPIANTNLR
jgi:hypothetical protein